MDIQKLKQRDHGAFNELVTEYEQKVYRTSYKIIGDHDLAYDAAQEVFIKIYNSIDKFKEESQLSTWIYRITVNVSIDFKRKISKLNTVSLTKDDDDKNVIDIASDKFSPETELLTKERNAELQSAINSLSEKHKSVIILRDIEGLTYEEVSTILNCSEGTMKSRLNRARANLSKILKKNGNLFFKS